jgi:hypothetical protein
MGRRLVFGLLGWHALASLCLAQAPTSTPSTPATAVNLTVVSPSQSIPAAVWPNTQRITNDSQPAAPGQAVRASLDFGEVTSTDFTRGAEPLTDSKLAALENNLAESTRELQGLQKQAEQAQTQAEGQRLQKQVDLLQKQVEVLQNMVRLLSEQLKRQPAPSTLPTDKLQVDVAVLQSRSQQAARRDQELANAVDDLAEHQDFFERYGPQLPAPLKELFLPSGNSETVLSIYGALAFGYSHILGDASTAANGAGRPPTPGGFYFGEFTPDFLLKLNDWIFLEAEIGVSGNGSVAVGSFAQADFIVNDWLTVIAGRFVAPIGFYNERLNNPWINKLPTDAPGSVTPLWMQVLPAMSLLGVQAQGSFYLGCSPLKMEYNVYISNGLNLTPATPGMPTTSELANLENMEDTFTIISNDRLVGGRLGLWWPEKGLEGGFSALYNGDYVAGGFEDSISLFAIDLNYHHGDWDWRAEYGMTFQKATNFQDTNIRREGFYTQIAYRPREACNKYLANTEFVYRYTWVDFHGIDPTALDLTTFSTPIDVPVRRQQNEFGINYYFYPRCVLKVAYQINDEPGFHLHDNQFISEFAWGW